jgi:hypothetical protein
MFGLGQFGGDFYSGFQKRNDFLLGERQKIARAFAEFKAQNPTASYQEFRNFADSMAGQDSPYLRGALPADEMLQELGRRGDALRKQDEQRRAVAAMEDSLKREGLTDEAIQRIIETGQWSDDPNKVAGLAAEMFGRKDDQEFLQNFISLDPIGRGQKVRRKLADDWLNKTSERIKNNLIGSPDQLGLPDYLGDDGKLVDSQARQLLEGHLGERKFELLGKAVQLASNMREVSPASFGPFVRAALPPGTPPEQIEAIQQDMFNNWKAEKEKEQARYDDQQSWREREWDRDEKRYEGELIQKLAADPQVQLAVLGGDDSRVRAALAPILRASGVEGESILQGVIDTVKARVSGQQEYGWRQQQQKVREAVPGMVDKDLSGARAMWGQIARVAPKSPNIRAALGFLANDFYIDNGTAAFIGEYVGKNAQALEAMGPEGVRADILSKFGKRIQSRTDRAKVYEDQLGRSMMQPQRFEEYVGSARAYQQSTFSQLEGELDAALRQKDPMQRLADAKYALQKAAELQRGMKQQFEMHTRNWQEWVSPDSKQPFNPTMLNRMLAEGVERFNRMAVRVRQLEAQAARSGVRAPSPFQTGPQTPGLGWPGGPSAVGPGLSPDLQAAFDRWQNSRGGGVSRDAAFQSLIQQESGGRPGVVGPETKFGRALGMTQLLPGTAKEMARKLGMPWRPELLTGKTPEAIQYQIALGRAYFNEGVDKHGLKGGLMYYHGGPNQRMWGPKTRDYAAEVIARARRAMNNR